MTLPRECHNEHLRPCPTKYSRRDRLPTVGQDTKPTHWATCLPSSTPSTLHNDKHLTHPTGGHGCLTTQLPSDPLAYLLWWHARPADLDGGT